jgi:hypothetical protein
MKEDNRRDFGVRIDDMPRAVVAAFNGAFAGVELIDPRIEIDKAVDELRRQKLRARWPDPDRLRAYIPIGLAFDSERLRVMIAEHSIKLADIDVIIGLEMLGDSEYQELPEIVLHVIRTLGCSVMLNVTVNY